MAPIAIRRFTTFFSDFQQESTILYRKREEQTLHATIKIKIPSDFLLEIRRDLHIYTLDTIT